MAPKGDAYILDLARFHATSLRWIGPLFSHNVGAIFKLVALTLLDKVNLMC